MKSKFSAQKIPQVCDLRYFILQQKLVAVSSHKIIHLCGNIEDFSAYFFKGDGSFITPALERALRNIEELHHIRIVVILSFQRLLFSIPLGFSVSGSVLIFLPFVHNCFFSSGQEQMFPPVLKYKNSE